MNTLPWSRPLTRADLDAWPEDGRRHELIDGCLLLTPVPTLAHQSAVGELSVCLHEARRSGDLVLHGPFDVVLAADTVVRPDLVVAPRAAYTERDLPVAPDLIVEVLTTNTRWIDLHVRFHRYEQAGVAAYWWIPTRRVSLRGNCKTGHTCRSRRSPATKRQR
ncbi:Uma2 family endonuclease [Kribbella sp. NPDC005582]|uniref:Uma2 family endonuclease n=1 Tax=Kribbella sp. NPDC005582 TaxID=3156893 RepID=UPI0033A6D625